MYIMNCKYDRSVLSGVAFAQIFVYKVMVLGRLYDNNVFAELSQCFQKLNLPYVVRVYIDCVYVNLQ